MFVFHMSTNLTASTLLRSTATLQYNHGTEKSASAHPLASRSRITSTRSFAQESSYPRWWIVFPHRLTCARHR